MLAVDYRGFADSSGSPSEKGLGVDARAAWDWLIDHGAGEGEGEGGSVIVVGHSLGTSVAAMLGESLAKDGQFQTSIFPYFRFFLHCQTGITSKTVLLEKDGH